MTHASRWLRRVELTLWVAGITLLAVAAAATLNRWNHQMQQERALLQRGSAASVVAPPAVSAVEVREQRPLAPRDSPAQSPRAIPLPDVPKDLRVAAKEVHEPAAPTVTPPRRADRPPAPPADVTAFGRIEIPRLGVGVIVEEGADEKTLSRAVGLVPGSARPGEAGNIVLAGHRDTFFRPLRKIELNDRIRVVVPPNTYEYQVQSIRVVEPHETDVLRSKGVEELTLVTCYPFRFIGPAPERFIVSAARVD